MRSLVTTAHNAINWGLSRISTPRTEFKAEYEKYKDATDAHKRDGHFIYSAIGVEGAGTTVYILDTGLQSDNAVG